MRYKIFILLLSSLTFAQAQKNEQIAKIEFSMAEEAYSSSDFRKAIEHLNRAEESIGEWKPRIAYLRILSYDKILDYNTKSYSLRLGSCPHSAWVRVSPRRPLLKQGCKHFQSPQINSHFPDIPLIFPKNQLS